MPEILLLGEAFGEQEEREGKPFVGTSGWILDGMLREIGIRREDCHVTNVFNLRPPGGNDVKNLCGPKAEGIPGRPALVKGKYALGKYAPELARLEQEIARARPNVVVALGATAAWALCDTTGIRAFRGAPLWSSRYGVKVLPTYHPAAIGRDWTLRPIVLSDLEKAKREATYPDIRRPDRQIFIEPTLNDLLEFEHKYILPSRDLSIDIETKQDQITCIGFAPDRSRCLVVPFYDPQQKDGNYWRDIATELRAWEWVRRMCGLRKRIVFQNGVYDMHFLWRRYGIVTPHAAEDTMLLHHALQPEMEKGLGFLGSVYTSESSWKFMRDDHDTVKRED
jgi:uracil-DNA glycosylase